jgi:hypothetical protein
MITNETRISYANLFTPRKNDKGEDEFGGQLIIPKTDTRTLELIRTEAERVSVKKWGVTGKTGPTTLRDGDTDPKTRGKSEYAGMMFMSVRSKTQPGIVDTQRQPVIDPRAIVSGDYIRADIAAYAYDSKGNKGVSFFLNNVQFLRKGEPLSGAQRAEDAFSDWNDSPEAF